MKCRMRWPLGSRSAGPAGAARVASGAAEGAAAGTARRGWAIADSCSASSCVAVVLTQPDDIARDRTRTATEERVMVIEVIEVIEVIKSLFLRADRGER